MVAALCVVSASAQSQVKDAFGIDQNSRCSLGLRVGSGTYVVGEYFYGKDAYIDARIGWEWANGFNLTALHMWNPKDWNWTPNLGWWFVDAGAGAGAFVGAGYGQVNFGVAGSAKFGILFKKVPDSIVHFSSTSNAADFICEHAVVQARIVKNLLF